MNTENEHSQTQACAAELEPDFAALIHDELPPARRAELENHLVECTHCRNLFNSYKNILEAASQLEEQDVTADFATRLKERIDHARSVRTRLHERRRLMFKARVLERPTGLKRFSQQCVRNVMPVAASIAVTVSFVIMAMNIDMSSNRSSTFFVASTSGEYIENLRVERLVSRFRGDVRQVSYTPGSVPVSGMLPDGLTWTVGFTGTERSEKCLSLLSEAQYAEYNRSVAAEKKGRGPFHTVGWTKFFGVFHSSRVENGQALLPKVIAGNTLAKTDRIAVVPIEGRIEIWRMEDWKLYTGADMPEGIESGEYIVTPPLDVNIERPEDMLDDE